ncbi:MAG: hypothetical protein ACYTBJ_14935 [Planctomycetota bacterium]|jgi:hypothetical protein
MAKSGQGRIYTQRKRRAGKVRRFELVLNPAYGSDHDAIEFMDNLPRGTKSDFARDAILMAIANERGNSEMDQMIDGLRADNAELRSMLADALARLEDLQSREVTVEMAQAVRVTTQSRPVDDTGTVASSGLNMDRPRPRPKLQRTQPAQIEAAEPDVLTEAESVRLGRMMAASIRKAQPGRRQ